MADFVKYQALGNDYLLIDPRESGFTLDGPAARVLCDRHFGVGADGVLIGPCGPWRPGEPVRLEIFNADGSACGRSANGIRMFALYLAEHDAAAAGALTVLTAAGETVVQVCDHSAGLVRIGLGRASFDPGLIPVRGVEGPAVRVELSAGGREFEATCVYNGNPHTVVLLDEADETLARDFGPLLAGHGRFPERTNVEFVRVLGHSLIEIEVYERGAGYTLASGSGAAAAAAAVRRHGLAGDAVTVRMPGGEVLVEFALDGAAWLTGVVEQVAAGELAPALRERLRIGRRRTLASAAFSAQPEGRSLEGTSS
jgi:diaminopimelate epimerase